MSDGAAETVTLELSKGQLAARLGTIPETLSRTLASLKREGILKVNGQTIQLLLCVRQDGAYL
jgi:CRP-like cAMP-binding protein